jgi:hypothetical protein
MLHSDFGSRHDFDFGMVRLPLLLEINREPRTTAISDDVTELFDDFFSDDFNGTALGLYAAEDEAIVIDDAEEAALGEDGRRPYGECS